MTGAPLLWKCIVVVMLCRHARLFFFWGGGVFLLVSSSRCLYDSFAAGGAAQGGCKLGRHGQLQSFVLPMSARRKVSCEASMSPLGRVTVLITPLSPSPPGAGPGTAWLHGPGSSSWVARQIVSGSWHN